MFFLPWLYFLLPVISIHAFPQALLVNGSIRITCVIPHRRENRKLIIAIENYSASEYQLDGETAPAIFQKTYAHVPCGVEAVSCTLIENTDKTIRVAIPVYVTGCE